jgi:hypothetical protein
MDQLPNLDPLAVRLRVMQIIIGSLLAGVLGFMVIAVLLRASGDQPIPEQPLVSYIALAVAGLNVVLAWVIPNIMVGAARKRIAGSVPGREFISQGKSVTADDAGQLCMVYQSQLLIGAALLEGATFFLQVAYIIEGRAIGLIVAALLTVGLAWMFPTGSRLTGWIERQEQLIAAERLRAYDAAN